MVPVDREGDASSRCAPATPQPRSTAPGRWSADGERSLRALLRGDDVIRLDDIDERDLVDVDTPAEAGRWGIRAPGSLEP